MQNVTVLWLAEQCKVSDGYIRQLLIAKELIGEKPDGRGWTIDLDNPKNREFFNKNRKDVESLRNESTQVTEVNNVTDTHNLQSRDTQLIRDLIEDIKRLSFEAGQKKLLSDNLKEKEHDAKYWKDEYFKLQYKYDEVTKENTELKEQLNQRKSFWGRWKK